MDGGAEGWVCHPKTSPERNMRRIERFYWSWVYRLTAYVVGESSYWHDIARDRLAELDAQG